MFLRFPPLSFDAYIFCIWTRSCAASSAYERVALNQRVCHSNAPLIATSQFFLWTFIPHWFPILAPHVTFFAHFLVQRRSSPRSITSLTIIQTAMAASCYFFILISSPEILFPYFSALVQYSSHKWDFDNWDYSTWRTKTGLRICFS